MKIGNENELVNNLRMAACVFRSAISKELRYSGGETQLVGVINFAGGCVQIKQTINSGAITDVNLSLQAQVAPARAHCQLMAGNMRNIASAPARRNYTKDIPPPPLPPASPYPSLSYALIFKSNLEKCMIQIAVCAVISFGREWGFKKPFISNL